MAVEETAQAATNAAGGVWRQTKAGLSLAFKAVAVVAAVGALGKGAAAALATDQGATILAAGWNTITGTIASAVSSFGPIGSVIGNSGTAIASLTAG